MIAFFTETTLGILLLVLGQCLLVLVPILVSLAFLMYADRKIWAAVMMRRGPNVVGPWGLLQSFADFLKYIVKEIVVPAGADRAVFFLAPIISLTLAIIAWAVIPFNDGWVLSDINVAILYVFAVSSLEVYGVIMGGWASNSKYPFLGSLRSAAQMISYEVSIGLIIIGVIISTGSMNLTAIVHAQDTGYGILGWYWLPHFPMLFLFFISALAETNRPPFDLPEAESELVAGYQVEYSSTPFLLFMIGELMAVVLMCALVSLLFLGGWLSPIPGLPDGVLWMVLKMVFCFFIFAMVKAITPRYRYDQLMRLGWKVFLPMSLGWVVIVAFLAKFDVAGGFWARWDVEPTVCEESIAAFGDFLTTAYGADSTEATTWAAGEGRLENAASHYFPAAFALLQVTDEDSDSGGLLVLPDGSNVPSGEGLAELAGFVLLSEAAMDCLGTPTAGTPTVEGGIDLLDIMIADMTPDRRAEVRRLATELAGE